MNVILLERIERLGQMGDVVSVADGYARNFLLPRKKALRATAGNRDVFETRRAQFEADNLERRKEAEQVAEKMADLSVVMIRQAGDSGQLYGSVSGRDISTAVTEAGFTIERRQVVINRAFKALGLYPVRVVLHPEVSVEVTVNIARSEEEAKLQAQGVDVTATDMDEPFDETLVGEVAPESEQSTGAEQISETPEPSDQANETPPED